jgi:hypothetical protein
MATEARPIGEGVPLRTCTHQPGTADPSCACVAAQAMKRAYDPVQMVAHRMAMAIRTSRRCEDKAGRADCWDQTCRALAAWEALPR